MKIALGLLLWIALALPLAMLWGKMCKVMYGEDE